MLHSGVSSSQGNKLRLIMCRYVYMHQCTCTSSEMGVQVLLDDGDLRSHTSCTCCTDQAPSCRATLSESSCAALIHQVS